MHSPVYNVAPQVLRYGQGNRATASTIVNADSSRSHSIFTIKLSTADANDHAFYGRFSIVDLAGSERATRTQNTGQRLREASNINVNCDYI